MEPETEISQPSKLKETHGELYGTPKAALEKELAAGRSVILDIDPVGAFAIRKCFPKDSVLALLLPPSWKALEARLRKRGDTPEDEVKRRLREAAGMIRHWRRYDYVVVNDTRSRCVKDLEALVRAEDLRTGRQTPRVAPLVEALQAHGTKKN